MLYWLTACAAVNPQHRLVRVAVPASTPGQATIFVAGTFNNWHPADSAYLLTKNKQGSYEFLLPATDGSAEFKFTRGSWQTVETDEQGREVANRSVSGQQAGAHVLEVKGWKDMFAPSREVSTAAPNVQVPDSLFYMPQLNRNRQIRIYLPPGYASSSERYPVLYMHDGQNLFDKATSFSGEWGLDETLNQLTEAGKTAGVIVVGIDNGGDFRIAEYSPWKNKAHGGGEGAAYLQFIVETLKPYIDQRYRTLPQQQHTGLAGSSLGGLISLYGAVTYPNVFGKIGVFSPAFWFNPEIFDYTRRNFSPATAQEFYFVASRQESETMVPLMQQMQQLLLERGVAPENIGYSATEDGAHKEWFWQREFPAVFLWLFSDKK